MKMSLIQMNTKSADIEENSAQIKKYIEQEDAELIIFPELAITGLGCCDYFADADFINRQNEALEDITSLTVEKDVLIGFAEKTDEGLYSSVA
ncbi:MAG: nitrilase-related carbon-nitrogen hydrolase, partial [Candidatus Gastranaerophilaceae bacterium]